MKIETFDEEQFIKSTKLFSSEFEDPTKFAYHGTSTLFSSEIEQDGFQFPFSVVPRADLGVLADSLPGNQHELAEALRDASRYVTRLGFAPYSYAAVNYAYKRGGQVISFCRRAVDAGGKPTEAIANRLQSLDGARPCVYAVDLSQHSHLDLSFDRLFIQSSSSVPASRIAAKIVLPDDFDVNRLRALQKLKPLSGAMNERDALVQKLRPA